MSYAESSPKVREWGEIMTTFQVPPPGAKEGQTWVAMEQIYDFENLNQHIEEYQNLN
jgi:hypothetical protein